MVINNLFAELQLNPRSQAAYRKISEYYLSLGMKNEADAFQILMKRKFDDNNSHTDKEQRKDDKINT
jgi:hypothetical protein